MAFEYLQLDVVSLPQHILAQKSAGSGLCDRLLQILPLFFIFMIRIDEGRLGLNGMSGDQAAFDQLVGKRLEQVPVLECPRLVLAGITDEIMFLHPMIQHLVPFDSGRESGAAPATKPGFFQFGYDILGFQAVDAPLPRLIAPHFEITFNLPGSPFKLLD